MLVSAVVYHGRTLGLDVTVAEIHDLWLTTPKVIVTGNRPCVQQFESDVLRGCTFLKTGGLLDIDQRSEPHRYAEAFANWLAQQSDGAADANPSTRCGDDTVVSRCGEAVRRSACRRSVASRPSSSSPLAPLSRR